MVQLGVMSLPSTSRGNEVMRTLTPVAHQTSKYCLRKPVYKSNNTRNILQVLVSVPPTKPTNHLHTHKHTLNNGQSRYILVRINPFVVIHYLTLRTYLRNGKLYSILLMADGSDRMAQCWNLNCRSLAAVPQQCNLQPCIHTPRYIHTHTHTYTQDVLNTSFQ